MTKPDNPAVATEVARPLPPAFGDTPGSSARREPPSEMDDLGWDVPDEESAANRDDENFDPDDDSDLEMDQDDEDENVGLDTTTGFEDAGDDLELDDSGEGERWTTDSETEEDQPGAESDAESISGGDEYGYLGEDEPNEHDEELDTDLDEGLPSLDDGGVEGVDDESDLEEFELGGLPDLDSSAEEEGEGFGTETMEELAGVNLAEDPMLELVPGHPWKLLPPSAVRVSQVATLPGPALALVAHSGRIVLSAGDGWFAANRSGLVRLPVDAPPGRSLALADHEGRLVFVLASPAGLYLSLDGGRSFERQRESDPPTHVALTRAAGKLRIWARNARGMLLMSDDLGRSYTPSRLEGHVISFATDGDRRLCALVKRGGRVSLGTSSDSGRRWSWAEDAASGGDADAALMPCRGASMIATRQGVGFAQAGQASRPVAALLQAPAALLDEDDESFVYACAPRDDQTLIVRSGTRGAAQPMVITSLARSRVGEPRQLTASFAEGGFVTLHVATDEVLLRIEASLDGEDLP